MNYRQLARQKARKYGVPEDVFEAQIQQESGFNPKARSPAGAGGIAQIMPGTARSWGVDPMDPEAALDAAAKNMGRYIKKYGVEGALRAYNAGEGAIEKSKGYRETNDYVKRIMGGARSGRSSVPRATEQRRTTSASATARVSALDEDAYNEARRRYALASYLQKRNPGSPLLKILPSSAPLLDDFRSTASETVTSTGRGRPRQRPAAGRPSGGSRPTNLTSAAQLLDRLGAQYGAPVTAKQEPGHATGGDHDPAVRGATARDFGGGEAQRRKLFRRITQDLGVRNAQYKGSDINVVKDGLRYQIISRDHGTGPHLHVGVRKAK